MPASTSQRRTKPKVRRNSDVIENWKGYREIHIEGDWLVIYRVEKQELQLVLTRTGSHDDLF